MTSLECSGLVPGPCVLMGVRGSSIENHFLTLQGEDGNGRRKIRNPMIRVRGPEPVNCSGPLDKTWSRLTRACFRQASLRRLATHRVIAASEFKGKNVNVTKYQQGGRMSPTGGVGTCNRPDWRGSAARSVRSPACLSETSSSSGSATNWRTESQSQ